MLLLTGSAIHSEGNIIGLLFFPLNSTGIPFFLAAIVLLVWSNAVNQIAGGGSLVSERSAVEGVGWDLTDPSLCEHLEALRKAAVLTTAVILESNAHRGALQRAEWTATFSKTLLRAGSNTPDMMNGQGSPLR